MISKLYYHIFGISTGISSTISVTCTSQAKETFGKSETESAHNSEPKVGHCVFPFVYESNTYTSCAQVEEYGGVGWCAFDYAYKDGEWGYCTLTCPYAGTYFKICDLLEFNLIYLVDRSQG